MADNSLASPLLLPCGVTLSNRIAKAAMTEGLADTDDCATERLNRLYGRWSDGGAGLLITGNVMVDRRYLERPGNVVIDGNGGEDALRRWALAGSRAGNQLWMQINHPGRQCTRMSSNAPVAPSAVQLRGMLGLVAKPRAMKVDEIEQVIVRWAEVAAYAKRVGFSGVQVHSAHGYLCSQFLSPLVNRRSDEWGGSLENRARLLLSVVKAVRAAVGPAFPISVKLNSADFQQGGFSNEESAQVAAWLGEASIDLLEVSGGTYEQMALFGRTGEETTAKAASTRKREAYFLDYAATVREACPSLPLMVTGGFRTAALMHEAVHSGLVDVVGIARPFCVLPELAHDLLNGVLDKLPTPERKLFLGTGLMGRASSVRGVRSLNSQAEASWFYQQLVRLGDGLDADTSLGAWSALMTHFRGELTRSRARTFRNS